MKRIIIIGVTGSGKTMLGQQLSVKLEMPAIDLDEVHWLPGWQERDTASAVQRVEAATAVPAWVISGNYSKFRDIFWPRADTLIWLDYSFPVVFSQLWRRSMRRIIDRQVICNGNYETWRKFFSKDSIMVWLFKSFHKRKRAGDDVFSQPEQYPHLTLIRFRSPEETEAWLEKL